ncbi:hypothetical protein OXPF_11520 [Oxobacter pfennigii]|uniref:GtrA/DPMS transmembrane domain-containing protein n=1 Tax=Oxobacter pfennigii TaxID=36849 RepID=A0A0P8WBF4_9CLOT|nr:GtrA family protein [Oxobacter pfennigii]KPU45260.1 hypothetical protein OXPF_11520 [Oxobacter pfennigii]
MIKKFDLLVNARHIWKIFKYLILGVITTIINFCVFSLCLIIGMHYMVSNFTAFVISVLFAYFTNKKWIFSDSNTEKLYFPESIKFIGARIFTLVLESIILYIFIKKMSLNEYGVKVAANIMVVIINYILSEFIVFKKDKNGDKAYYE